MKAEPMSTRSPAGLMTQIRRRGEHLHRLLVQPGLEKEIGFLQAQLLHQALGISQVNPHGAGVRKRPGDRSGECSLR